MKFQMYSEKQIADEARKQNKSLKKSLHKNNQAVKKESKKIFG